MALTFRMAGLFEQTISQANHNGQDAISLGQWVLKFTIKNLPDSTSNVWIGVNMAANNGNFLQPGESVTYETKDGYVYTDNQSQGVKLYLRFPDPGDGGRALVIVEYDANVEKTIGVEKILGK